MGKVQCNGDISWITRTLSLQLAQSTIYINNAKALWDDLKEIRIGGNRAEEMEEEEEGPIEVEKGLIRDKIKAEEWVHIKAELQENNAPFVINLDILWSNAMLNMVFLLANLDQIQPRCQ